MLNGRAGITRGLVTIALIASVLMSEETTAKLFEEPVNSQTTQSTEHSSRLEQLYAAHQQAKAQRKRVDDEYPAELEALLNKGKKQAAEAAIRLAQYYAVQQKWRLAESFIVEALQLQSNDIGYLKMATQFAYDQKNYGQAEKFILRAIQQIQQQPDFTAQQSLNLKDNLAVIYIAKGQYQNAENTLQQTLQIRYRTLDENHPDIAKNLIKLSSINALQQELKQAEEQLSTALAMLQPDDKHNADLIAFVKRNLGEVKRTRSQQEKAGATLQ